VAIIKKWFIYQRDQDGKFILDPKTGDWMKTDRMSTSYPLKKSLDANQR
jgi:hypothetical protein